MHTACRSRLGKRLEHRRLELHTLGLPRIPLANNHIVDISGHHVGRFGQDIQSLAEPDLSDRRDEAAVASDIQFTFQPTGFSLRIVVRFLEPSDIDAVVDDSKTLGVETGGDVMLAGGV